ncbi:hypothetical protein AAF712_016063 [Marasmius tenuissimus]|uniref:DNA 3'-5' helicase n=1 Tax=Marasmius tenuissimus TaxID=585030 RepID=A0ABR2Z8X6_9AGAR
MPPRLKWTDPDALSAITLAVSRCIPQWPNGLRDYQREYIPAVLNGDNLAVFAATGEGKSAFFCVPIAIHNELSKSSELYPDLPWKEYARGIVVTPTKGLAASIVSELKLFRIEAFAYTHENLTKYRIEGIDVVDKICESRTWQVICVDPEHLQQKEWRRIMKNDTFIKSLVYFCCEEVHLIRDWGAAFRPSFKFIGSTACGELPDHIPIIALSATCPPGLVTDSVCKSLGLIGNNFHTIRRSNERLNMQLVVEPYKRVHGFSKYHQIYPYVCSGRKLVIHVNTIPEAYDIYLFLFNLLPESCNRLRRVVIATIGFANGINRQAIRDCISWKLPATLDQLLQQLGRGGRLPEVLCRGIAIASPEDIKKARAFVSALPADTSRTSRAKKKSKSTTQDAQSLDGGKAQLLAEDWCITRACNVYYQNPPIEVSSLDCYQAERSVYCSLCAARHGVEYDFASAPYPDDFTDIPPSWLPLPPPKKKSKRHKSKTWLGKSERKSTRLWLLDFRKVVWSEVDTAKYPDAIFYPSDLFLSHTVIETILDKFLVITEPYELAAIIKSNSWPIMEAQSTRLFVLIQNFQNLVREWRRLEEKERLEAKKGKAVKAAVQLKIADDSDESDEDVDMSSDGDQPPGSESRSLRWPKLQRNTGQKEPTTGEGKV